MRWATGSRWKVFQWKRKRRNFTRHQHLAHRRNKGRGKILTLICKRRHNIFELLFDTHSCFIIFVLIHLFGLMMIKSSFLTTSRKKLLFIKHNSFNLNFYKLFFPYMKNYNGDELVMTNISSFQQLFFEFKPYRQGLFDSMPLRV